MTIARKGAAIHGKFVKVGHAEKAERQFTHPDKSILDYFLDGQIAVDVVAKDFGLSKSQLADTVGLSRDSLYKAARVNAVRTQSRVREMLEIISLISNWAGSKEQAMAWYRAQPIPAFGGRTSESLVKSGQAAIVRDYLDHLAMGGFA